MGNSDYIPSEVLVINYLTFPPHGSIEMRTVHSICNISTSLINKTENRTFHLLPVKPAKDVPGGFPISAYVNDDGLSPVSFIWKNTEGERFPCKLGKSKGPLIT